MKKRKEVFFAIVLSMIMICAIPMISLANVEETFAANGSEISTRAILRYNVYGTSDDTNRISVQASLVVQDSYNQIIDVTKVWFSGSTSDISNVSVGNVTIWNNGEYASVPVNYRQKGITGLLIDKSTTFYFYP